MNGDIYKDGTLFIHTKGTENLGVGIGALPFGTGQANTAIGAATLQSNTTGTENTAVGFQALQRNTAGLANTAVGMSALFVNTAGDQNTAIGFTSLTNNSTGSANTATGNQALMVNRTGSSNTATGFDALNQNTTGSQNTAFGSGAGASLTTGSNNVAMGNMTGTNITTGNYNVHISNRGTSTDTNLIRIGDSNQNRTFIAGIRGVTTGNADALPVVIDSTGQLGTVGSSRRMKTAIERMGDTTETIMGLRPVRFRYKAQGPTAAMQYGLIAEEVAEVAPDLAARKPNGEIETVYYDKVNAMLLNEVQKLHRENEALVGTLRRLEKRLASIEGGARN